MYYDTGRKTWAWHDSLGFTPETDLDVILQTSSDTPTSPTRKVEVGTKTRQFRSVEDSDQFWTTVLHRRMVFDFCFDNFVWTTFKKNPKEKQKKNKINLQLGQN